MPNCRVMVVDEDPEFRDVVLSTIANRGFEMFPAADGIDALRQIYDVNPDLIVIDAELRDLSGFRFLPFVRRRFPKISVIALWSQGNSTLQKKDIVADEILPRTPFKAGNFIRVVEEFRSRPAPKRVEAV